MEISSEQKDLQRQQLPMTRPKKGGFKTMPFIIVNESFERVASYGLMPNMIFYLTRDYHMKTANGASILFLWSAISNALAIVGAFLSDSSWGRFRVIVFGSFASLLGMSVLWLTAMIPELRPPSCHSPSDSSCRSATPAELAVLLSSFILMATGTGCIRPCSMAFGADQLDRAGKPKNEGLLQSFFNWYYASVGVSSITALTVLVYIQDHLGWKVGFGVPAILMAISTSMFLLGSSLYVKLEAESNLFVGFIQVLVAAFKNRSLAFPPRNSDFYHAGPNSKSIAPTEKLRFLNKACIMRNPEKELNSDGSASNPWSLCTADQVECLKALLRVLPIWSTGVMVLISLTQYSTFATLQASIMDRHISPKFQIPAGSFPVFTVLTLTIWLTIYDRAIVPALAKYTGRPRGISSKIRMAIGLLCAVAAIAMAAIQEGRRRKAAIDGGLADRPRAVVDMSAMWLVPQFCLFGLAEAFNAIGQIDFYYSQFPRSMGSIAVALFSLGMAVAYSLASLLVKIVDGVTGEGGKESWISNNLNKGHLDYYYWLMTVLSVVNFGYFLVCCWAYGPSKDEVNRVESKEDDS